MRFCCRTTRARTGLYAGTCGAPARAEYVGACAPRSRIALRVRPRTRAPAFVPSLLVHPDLPISSSLPQIAHSLAAVSHALMHAPRAPGRGWTSAFGARSTLAPGVAAARARPAEAVKYPYPIRVRACTRVRRPMRAGVSARFCPLERVFTSALLAVHARGVRDLPPTPRSAGLCAPPSSPSIAFPCILLLPFRSLIFFFFPSPGRPPPRLRPPHSRHRWVARRVRGRNFMQYLRDALLPARASGRLVVAFARVISARVCVLYPSVGIPRTHAFL
ncbi:hypothetical protein HYPSUDRAFT_200085 [Hypholoma sublateritium FD-334 SS-4]|uniref:Uncharacterized protein n=1 Tax=Hypholoma sublateritium (strain FD-334 SS-4) TaxID=945553 RepID=A0A0D2P2S9_HYPSF|nr:hypothetical protein HYPSUDRAFT_200085 [Hypholoma sublateritium FD-334 SS-4]